MASLHESPTPSQHSVERLTALAMTARRLSRVDSPIAFPGVTGEQLARSIGLPITSSYPGLGTQGIIITTI